MELNDRVRFKVTTNQKELLNEYAYQNRTTASQVLRNYIDTLKLK